MYPVSYKNTFLSFGEHQDEDDESRPSVSTSRAASPRSRSLECSSKTRQSEDAQAYDRQLTKLNEMLVATQQTCSTGRSLPHVMSASTMADEFDGMSELDQVEFDMTIEEISDESSSGQAFGAMFELSPKEHEVRRCFHKGDADGNVHHRCVQHPQSEDVLVPTLNSSACEGGQRACEACFPRQTLPHVTSGSTLADDWSDVFERNSDSENVEFNMTIDERSADADGERVGSADVAIEVGKSRYHYDTGDGESNSPNAATFSFDHAEGNSNHGGASTPRIALYRVSCRNTFLSFDEQVDEDMGKAASPRSSSLGCKSSGRCSLQVSAYEEQLRKLNDVLASPRPFFAGQANENAAATRAPQRSLQATSASTQASTSSTNEIFADVEGSQSTKAPLVDGAGFPVHSNEQNALAHEGCQVCKDTVSSSGRKCGAEVSPLIDDASTRSSEATVGNYQSSRDYRHGQVPKKINFALEYESSKSDQPATTLMIRNIPNRCTQRELIKELEDLGFADTFDFLYLPVDKGTMASVGYAFVNFLLPEYAERCMQVFQNYRFRKNGKVPGKSVAISVAHIQGLHANLAHYEKAAVSTAKLKHRRPWVRANISNIEEKAVVGRQ